MVSGVTSAISVPAAAGIPVTHRGLAKGFSVVTGHEELSEVPARADHTIVLLMGVGQLRESAAALAGAGLPPGPLLASLRTATCRTSASPSEHSVPSRTRPRPPASRIPP